MILVAAPANDMELWKWVGLFRGGGGGGGGRGFLLFSLSCMTCLQDVVHGHKAGDGALLDEDGVQL